MYRYYLLIAFSTITLTANLFGQDKIIGKPVSYETEDGKYYIQKKLPVYLYISNSPDSNTVKTKLRSKESIQYTNPMYFDTDGFNSLRTNWAVDKKSRAKVLPQHEIVFEVYADSKSPDTYGLFNKKVVGYSEGKRVYPSGTKLTLLNYDAVSGTSKIYYSINKDAFIEYVQPIEFNVAKKTNIQFYGIDNVGNTEEIHELNFIIQ